MFEALLSKIAQSLGGAGLPYMIIGGQAVLLYGTPRLTRDIDITLGVSVDELGSVLKAVKDMGLDVVPQDVRPFVEKTFVLPARESTTGIRVDFIFSFTPYERQAIARANPVFFGETAVMFASVEDVLIHKIFAGRPRDLEDGVAILIKNPAVDRGYILKWLREFDRTMDTHDFTSRFSELCDQSGCDGP